MEQFITLDEAKKKVNAIIDNGFEKIVKHILTNKNFANICVNPSTNLKKPEIRWRKFGFTIAGITLCESNIIEMNINYLYSKDYDKFIKSTPLHELAHSITFQLFNTANHDKLWKYVDSIIGDIPERCHDYARPTNAPKKLKYIYECPDCKTIFKLSEQLNKKRMSGMYCCKKCKTNLANVKFIKTEYI